MPTFRDFVPEQRFQPTLAISPDGSHVAYSCNASGQYNVWLQPLAGGERRALTHYTDQAVRQVAWAPDGRSLAFAADRDGDEQFQIHVIDVAGGDARRLTHALERQHALGAAPFTPDGRTLVYAGNDRDPSVQDVLVHDLGTDEVRRVESEPGLLLFASSVSPDGHWLLAVGARSNTDSDCYLVDLADPALPLHLATAHQGEIQHDAGPWAPDSSGFHVRTDGGGEFQGLSFYSVADARLTPGEQPEWDVEQITATDDGAAVAWTVNRAGVSVAHVRHGDDAPVVLGDGPRGQIDALEITPDGRRLVFLLSTATRPTDVAVLDGATGAFDYLTDSRPPALARVEARAPALVDFPTHDGRRIPAWLYRPAGDGPFPVVVSIHGGPEAQERPV